MCLYLLYLSNFDNIMKLFDFFLILCFVSNQNHIRKMFMLLVSQTCYCSIVVCLRQYITQNMWTKTCLQGCKCKRKAAHILMFVCMYVCMHVYVYIYIYIYIYIYMYVYVYVCMNIYFSLDFMLLFLSHTVMENQSYVQLFINDPWIIYFLKYFNVSCCTTQNEKPVQKCLIPILSARVLWGKAKCVFSM